MNKPEQQFWELIKGHLPGDVSRVENIADSGTPDVTGAWFGNDYWIELKVNINKGKIVHPEKLCRPAQLVWHARRSKHGTKILVITRYPTQIVTHNYINKEYEPALVSNKVNNRWPWQHFEDFIKQMIQRKGSKWSM